MSKIEVDAIDKQSGSTLTLGGSGTAVTLACGATQTGFGRTGTVDWQTGSIKTSTFTAANGEGYFANTSGGAFTMNLPAGTAGNIVSVVDYTNSFQTHNLTIAANGSQKIGGIAASPVLSTEGQSVTFVYVDDTEGWKNVQDSTSNVTGRTFIAATGGTVTTVNCGQCKVHTFTGPGTFCVSAISTTTEENVVSYMVIAGGGGGGYCMGGGGGAGGYREIKSPTTPYTASPLDGYSTPANRLTVTVAGIPVTVGAGGAGSTTNPNKGTSGVNSTFSTITSAGGGGGGSRSPSAPSTLGIAGGSGGGNANDSPPSNTNPAGNTPPVSPPQGNNGGFGRGNTGVNKSGGGGGATAVGGDGGPGEVSGPGGAGATSSINATPTGRAGGASGGIYSAGGHSKGTASDGGGVGGPGATDGTVNTGGGGGGGGHPADGGTQNGGTGGSGIVIIRYKIQ